MARTRQKHGQRPPDGIDTPPGPPRPPRWFWLGLALIVVGGGGLRLTYLAEYVHSNPLATHPRVDAETYWQWGGRIAAGQPGPHEPFFSAPLYPYLVGLGRALGAGLTGVYSIQTVLDLLTIALLAWIGCRRFGAAVGLTAGALFALLLEPASFAVRILGSTIQLPIVCLVWLALLRVGERPASWWRAVLAGGALGLFALSFPPAILLVPLAALWLWWRGGFHVKALGRAATLALAGTAVISPATIYNYRACGELIPISAQAGLTFAHGNAPGADGTYAAQPGVAQDRDTQNRDALRVYRETTGRPPSWNGTNRFFFERGLTFWHTQPGAAFRLLMLKLWYFLTGRNYGDIYIPVAERAEGFANALWLLPIQTAWLLPMALVAVLVWLRHVREHLPELLLFALPLLVVVLFFYSPRYRFPAIPIIVVAAAWTLAQAIRNRRRLLWPMIAGVALVLGFVLGPVNRAAGFDPLPPRQAYLCAQLGWLAQEAGRLQTAATWYSKALQHEPDYVPAMIRLGTVLTDLGQASAAVAGLQRAVDIDPADAFAHQQLGHALLAQHQVTPALDHLRTAVRLSPADAGIHNDLANALLQAGDRDGARAEYETALHLDPANAQAHVNLGLLLRATGETDAALEHFQTALRADPALAAAHYQLGTLQLERGTADGLAALSRAHELAPDDVNMGATLAWYLATLPDRPPADRATALQLAQRAATAARGRSPQILNVLAAALAANGRFDEAVQTIDQAIQVAEAAGAGALAERFRARRALYAAHQPSIAPLEPPRP